MNESIKPVFRFCLANIPPYFEWKRENGKVVLAYSEVFTFNLLANALKSKFDIEIVPAVKDELGSEISPGNFSGLAGMVQRKEADAYYGWYVVNEKLLEVVKYSTAFTETYFSILSGEPQNSRKTAASIFSAIEMDVWIILSISWIVITLLYAFISRMETKYDSSPNVTDSSVIEVLLTLYGLLFQRGFDNLPKTSSRRILVTGWLIMVTVLMVDLGGSFSSKLAVQDQPVRIDDLEDILKQPHLKVFTPKGYGFDEYVMKSPRENYQAVWKQIERSEGLIGWSEFYVEDFISGIVRGEAVVVGFSNALLDTMVSRYCQKLRKSFYKSRGRFLTTTFAMILRKDIDHDLLEIFNSVGLQYGGMGFTRKLWEKHNRYARPCYEIVHSRITYAPLTPRDLEQLIHVLGLGLLSGCVCFICEMISLLPGMRLIRLLCNSTV